MAKRVFERLRDEHGFTGGYTIIKDYMRKRNAIYYTTAGGAHSIGDIDT